MLVPNTPLISMGGGDCRGSLREMGLGRSPRKGEVGRLGEVAEAVTAERGGGMETDVGVDKLVVRTGEAAVWESGGSWKVGLLLNSENDCGGVLEMGESPS